MLPRFRPPACSGSRDGVALVIVLAFIVLTSILIVSFIAFSSSNRLATSSYAKAIQAQEIAQGGLQDILNDLHQEIAAGSTAYTNNGTVIYVPTTNYTASPRRLGYDVTAWGKDVNSPLSDDLSPSLVRVSRASQTGTKTDLYPPMTNSYFTSTSIPSNRASAASTATSSANGRSVSFSRWNKSLLLSPSTSVGDPQVNPYVIPGVFATNYTATTNSFRLSGNSGGDGYASAPPPYGPPDWVYVTRGGSRALIPSDLTSTTASVLPSNNLESTTAVVGRYAYVIYDEGALLDMNVVGFPQTATNASSAYLDANSGITHMIMGKTHMGYADLSIAQLMGNATTNLATISNFVSWRNAAGLSNASNNYMAAATAASTNGFLGFTSNGTTGDSPLVSRQDLINYMINADPPSSDGTTGYNSPAPNVSKALPYLGTFSRSLSAPTYFPTTNAPYGTNFNYAANADASPTASPFSTTNHNPNQDLANLRWPGTSSIIVTHYNDDGVSTSFYTAVGGTQFLQSRFPLDRIKWLANDPYNVTAPNSNYSAAVQACFGLTWGNPGLVSTGATSTANGGNPCWNYTGSTSSTPVSIIETLDVVASEGREPNFFELLKAAILNGSLGLSPGMAACSNLTTVNLGSGLPGDFASGAVANDYLGPGGLFCWSYDGHKQSATPPTPTVYNPSGLADFQIMQIGVNIIDQFGSTGYPSAIYFKWPGVGVYDPVLGTGGKANPIYGPVTMVYGDKNLPYLSRVVQVYTSPNPAGATNPPDDTDAYTAANGGTVSLAGWMQPELWNPHQQPAAPLANAPKNFEIRAYGSTQFYWHWSTSPGGRPAFGEAPSMNWFLTNSNTETNTYGTIDFTEGSTTSSFYDHPFLLTSDSIPAYGSSTVSIPSTTNTANIAKSNFPYYAANSNKNHFVAFLAGLTPSTDSGTPYQPYWTDLASNSRDAKTYPINSIGTASEPIYANSYALGWLDKNNGFHPYSFITGAFPFGYAIMYSNNGAGDTRNGSVNVDSLAATKYGHADPRTDRFSVYIGYFSGDPSPIGDCTLLPGKITSSGLPLRFSSNSAMPNATGFFPAATRNAYPQDWAVNSSNLTTTLSTSTGASTPLTYYTDPDGVIRPGDGVYGSTTTGDGLMLYNGAYTDGIYSGSGVGAPTGAGYPVTDKPGNDQHGRRPVILNRPFRNVGELSYTFRDLPFKTLDFFSPYSADAGLLDVFSVQDETRFATDPKTSITSISSVVAGRVNPNNSPAPVLASIFSYASKKDLDSTYNMSAGDVKAVANAAVGRMNLSTGPNPILNRAGIATSLMNRAGSGMVNSFTINSDKINKPYFESAVRALSDNIETRSWTLLIDVIAQSGHFSPQATSLDNFIVDGEKRYWLHVSVDRYTGKIIDQQLELVYE